IGVNQQRCAIAVEKRKAVADAGAVERHIWRKHLGAENTAWRGVNVRQIARLGATAIEQTVLHAVVEGDMSARGAEAAGEVAAIATIVQMQAVPTRRQTALQKLHANQHARRRLGEGRLADRLA